jgi:hypothetical protein
MTRAPAPLFTEPHETGGDLIGWLEVVCSVNRRSR